MDTKGISQKAHQEEYDKREETISIKVYRISWYSVIAVMVFILALRLVYAEQFNPDITMILVAYFGATSFCEYYMRNKNIVFLFLGIMSIITFFLGLAILLRQYGVY